MVDGCCVPPKGICDLLLLELPKNAELGDRTEELRYRTFQ
jgi:hypothetical protein